MTFTPNTPGVFHGLPFSTYLSAPGVSRSMLEHMNPPARLPAYLSNRPEPTEAMGFGRLLHARLLEPRVAFEQFAAKPEGMKFSTTEGKEWREANWGRQIVSASDWDVSGKMIEAIKANEDCKAIFAEGESEVSAFATDESTGVLKKCRLDWLPKYGHAIVDLKSVRDASPDGFAKALWEYGWFCQSPFYLDTYNAASGESRNAFVFVCIEKEPPYLVACYQLENKDIARGREINAARLGTYAACAASGDWYGYAPGINPIGLPSWAEGKAVA